MASYQELYNKLDWALMFQRTGQFPLDRTDLFSSYADALKYAEGDVENNPDSRKLAGTSYVGQIITVYENDTVTVYKINADRTLGEVGSATVVDNKTIAMVDGVITIKGVAEAISANPGEVSGLQPVLTSDGSITWIKPDTTTVEGLSSALSTLKQSVDNIQTALDALDGEVTTLQTDVEAVEESLGASTDETTANTAWGNIKKNTSDIGTINTKLSTIASGAEVNVQSDWEETDNNSDAFIKNKPTKLSEFTNDTGFIDNTVANLTNYYTKGEIDTKIGNLATIQVQVVEDLPKTGDGNVIYLKAKTAPEEGNDYDEYLWNGTAFEKIGDTSINLSDYATTEYVDGKLEEADGQLTSLDTKVTGIDTRVTTLEAKQHATVVIPAAVITAGETSAEVTNVDNVISMYATDSDGEQVIIDWDKNGTTHTFSIGQSYNKDITVTLVYLA